MKDKLPFSSTLILVLLLAIAPAALASTTWYVNGVSGSNSNNCLSASAACKTIGHAISLAASGDTIMVAAATYAEHLTISFNLNLIGSGASTTVINGELAGRVVTISSSIASVTLSMMTIWDGLVGGSVARGGGIFNSGTLTINNCTIAYNQLKGSNGSFGIGIYNAGSLTINNSTVNQNRGGPISGGGGIYNMGKVTLNNSTLTGNSATLGGGIDNASGTVGVFSSTFSSNSAGKGANILTSGGRATVQNSIMANSPREANCSGAITSNGYNMSSDGTCAFYNSGDRNNTDPLLGALGNYGGPTQTIPLLSGSPAIDAGNPSGCTDGQGHLLKTDQRGQPRPDKKEDTTGCDMGAYERQTD